MHVCEVTFIHVFIQHEPRFYGLLSFFDPVCFLTPYACCCYPRGGESFCMPDSSLLILWRVGNVTSFWVGL